jgi:hypothetical protein
MEDLQKMMVVALIYRLLVCFYEVSYWLEQVLSFNNLILGHQSKTNLQLFMYFSSVLYFFQVLFTCTVFQIKDNFWKGDILQLLCNVFYS